MSRLGFFGKIPGHGDFVDDGLSGTFIAAWDDWLSRILHASQELLGDDWKSLYLSMPIWRFATASGIVDDQAWFGFVMPSVDRVGRYFPLTLAAPLTLAEPLSLLDQDQNQEWFARAEQVALSVLSNNVSNEHLRAELANLGLPENMSANTHRTDIACESGTSGIQISGTDRRAVVPALCAQLIKQRYQNTSVWWTDQSDTSAATTVICPGLPRPQQFCALMSGDWSRFSWTETNKTHDVAEGVS